MAARRAHRGTRTLRDLLLHATVILVAFVIIFPFLWMLSTSFKPLADVFRSPPKWIPSPFTLKNYRTILTDISFLVYFKNSIIVASSTTLISVAIAVFGAYSLARFRFFGIRIFSRLILFSYMLPSVLLIIPLFVILSRLRLVNSLFGLMLTNVTFVVPLALWTLSSFFSGGYRELEEAAMVDGCSMLGAFLKITLPLSMPGVVAIALYSFVLTWNDYLYALVMISSEAKKTLPLGIAAMATQYDIR
ncbi:MAG: carbohydrate ABC transporter permease [Deltaproteobacteria bacterium]|nr:carbohydrate ABC transporter permease [Deltaproteobacteria bacterium]